jgi:hypothetical protein
MKKQVDAISSFHHHNHIHLVMLVSRPQTLIQPHANNQKNKIRVKKSAPTLRSKGIYKYSSHNKPHHPPHPTSPSIHPSSYSYFLPKVENEKRQKHHPMQ